MEIFLGIMIALLLLTRGRPQPAPPGPGPDPDPDPDPPPGNGGPDPFGIRQLHPTASGGITWDSTHWNNGNSRTMTRSGQSDDDDPKGWSYMSGGNSQLVFRGNGIMSMESKDNGSTGPRIYVNPNRSGQKFRNTEATVYARLVNGRLASNGGVIWGCRSGEGHGSNDDNCTATTYYGAYRGNGSIQVNKELVHPTSPLPRKLGDAQRDIGGDWIGVKFVVQDEVSTGHVRFRMYVDFTNGQNGGDWREVLDEADRGDWESRDHDMSRCVREGKRTGIREIITASKSGGITMLRNTWNGRQPNFRMDFKWMTVREIDPLP